MQRADFAREKLAFKKFAARFRLEQKRSGSFPQSGPHGMEIDPTGLACVLAKLPGNEVTLDSASMELDRNQTVAEKNNRGVGSGTTLRPHSYRNIPVDKLLASLSPTVRLRGSRGSGIGGVEKSDVTVASACYHYCTNNVSLQTAARGIPENIAMRTEEVTVVPTPLRGMHTRRNPRRATRTKDQSTTVAPWQKRL